MRIGISTRGLNKGSFAISTIVLQLTRKIIELADSRHEIFLYCNDPRHEDLFSSTVHKRTCKLNNRFLWDQIWLPGALKKDRIDIALFMKGTMPAFIPCRGAVIFHDLGYFDDHLRPYRLAETAYMKTMMSRAAKKASVVFVDSNYTRSDAIRIFGLSPNKLNICYQDCSPIYQAVTDQWKMEEIRRHYQLPANFIFCPSSISPRKNISRILEAFRTVQDGIPQGLVITGGHSYRENRLMRHVSSKFSQRVHVLGEVPHEDMPGLYSLADFTIYPSLLEGFGMPVLEAFRCDCPILTSNSTSIPEVAGNAAYLVNPYDTNEIAKGIVELATDPKLRHLLISRGREQAKKFSWERTAQIILGALETC